MSWRGVTDIIMTTCRNTFGDEIRYKPVSGPELSLRGIFEETTETQQISSHAELEGAVAFVDFLAKDLTLTPKRGDMVIVGGRFYKVMFPEFDGYSRYRIYLREFLEE